VLDSLDPGTIVAAVEVGALSVGRHEVNVTVTPIEGLERLEVAPAMIRVEVSRGSTASAVPSVAPAGASLAPPGASPAPAVSAAPAASVGP
jgi:hypothetical protein